LKECGFSVIEESDLGASEKYRLDLTCFREAEEELIRVDNLT